MGQPGALPTGQALFRYDLISYNNLLGRYFYNCLYFTVGEAEADWVSNVLVLSVSGTPKRLVQSLCPQPSGCAAQPGGQETWVKVQTTCSLHSFNGMH